MGITREESNVYAKLMLNNPIRKYQLRGNGDFGYYGDSLNNLGEFILLKRCTPTSHNNQTKVLWEQSQYNLLNAHPSFKYKTHIANYLYKQINTLLANNNSNNLTGNEKIDAVLTSEKYQNYLQNEKIDLIRYVNDGETLVITAEGTGFAYHTKQKFYTKQELLSLLEEVRSTAHASPHAKLKRPYKKKAYIESNYSEYEQVYKQYEADFNQLCKLWDWKIKGDGLHMGVINDDIYNKILKPIEFRLASRTGPYKLVYEFKKMHYALEQYKDKLSDENITMMTVQL